MEIRYFVTFVINSEWKLSLLVMCDTCFCISGRIDIIVINQVKKCQKY